MANLHAGLPSIIVKIIVLLGCASLPVQCAAGKAYYLDTMSSQSWHIECSKHLMACSAELQVAYQMPCRHDQEAHLFMVFGRLSFVLLLLQDHSTKESLTADIKNNLRPYLLNVADSLQLLFENHEICIHYMHLLAEHIFEFLAVHK
jgi:hypothetical protein